jgi:hypothetical protein
MNNKCSGVLLAGILLLFASCEKEIQLDVEPHQAQLVINSTTITGEPLEVFVSKSVGMQEYNRNKNLNVPNATVIAKSGSGLTEQLMYNPATGSYTSTNNTNPGTQYTLTVSAQGLGTATASTHATSSVAIAQISRLRNVRLSAEGYAQDELKVVFDDPAGAGDYYIVGLHRVDSIPDTVMYAQCVNSVDPDIETISSEEMDNTTCLQPDAIFLRDQLFNGKRKELRLFVDSRYFSTAAPGTVFVHLSHVSEDFFRYYKSYLYATENTGNPFAEPINIYNNITNGRGVFSIMNTDIRVVE